jgi:hypothetical protein
MEMLPVKRGEINMVNMHKHAVIIVILLIALVFGMVFWKQLASNKNEIANFIPIDDNGPQQTINASGNSDATAKIEQELDGMNFDDLSVEASQLDEQISEL